MMNGLIINSL
ncbi:hypothetical protein YPPY61_3035, partial [Yersinia pestis PY-61]